jgi:hypothetical protein
MLTDLTDDHLIEVAIELARRRTAALLTAEPDEDAALQATPSRTQLLP